MHGEKIEYAKQVAGRCPSLRWVNPIASSSQVQRSDVPLQPSRRGRKATKPLFDTLVSMNANGQTDIPRAFDAVPRQRGASIRLFFTDFLFEDGIEPSLRKLRSRGGELHVFHLFSPSELHPSLRGDVLLVDQETGEEMAFSANPQRLQQYTESVMRWADDIEAKCRKEGVGYSRLLTSVPVEELVMNDLRKQGIVS